MFRGCESGDPDLGPGWILPSGIGETHHLMPPYVFSFAATNTPESSCEWLSADQLEYRRVFVEFLIPAQSEPITSATLVFRECGASVQQPVGADTHVLARYSADGIVELDDYFRPETNLATFRTDLNTLDGPWEFDVTRLVVSCVGAAVGFGIRLEYDSADCGGQGPWMGTGFTGFAIHIVSGEEP